jgi:hypothetical protein
LINDLTIGRIKYPNNIDDPVMELGLMYGFLATGTNGNGLQIHNKIFEIRITDYFVAKNFRKWRERDVEKIIVTEIIKDNVLDMELCLSRFKEHYAKIYRDKDVSFLERDGKLIFLTYLMPLINGKGFYHFESQTSDDGKMDLVIDFLAQQFILELKIWRGYSKHEDAYTQLSKYLKSKNMNEGYLLTFDFRKKGDESLAENKWIEWEGKRIFDVVVRVGENEELKIKN